MPDKSKAGTVEILRAVHKDNIALEKCQENLLTFVEKFCGQRTALKWKREIAAAALASYYTFTNLSGKQTLGEEYAGLVQTDHTKLRLPGRARTIAMIVLLCWGDKILEKSIDFILKLYHRHQRRVGGYDSDEDENKTQQVLRMAKYWLPWLFRLHTVVFYIQGKFYHVSKRFSGIHYLLVRRWFANQDENSAKNLRYLRILSIVNLAISSFNTYARWENEPDSSLRAKVKLSESSGRPCKNSHKCSLCLEKREEPCVTPCGHLFCWNCIQDWLQAKEECPICRTEVTPSRVVPLQNHF